MISKPIMAGENIFGLAFYISDYATSCNILRSDFCLVSEFHLGG